MAILAVGLALLGLAQAQQEAPTRGPAVVLEIEGAIGPATSDYIVRGIDRASERGADVIVLRMDTPGGLESAMREIIRGVLAAPVPVVNFVAPSGARATSAGTFISYAAHIAAMAPGTNIGAATPVQIGGPSAPAPDDDGDRARPRSRDGVADESGADAATEEGSDADESAAEEQPRPEARPDIPEKAISDAVAFIRSLAELRGRNADWAEKAVREAASLSADKAVEMNVVDLKAISLRDLLEQIDGRTVTVQGVERTLDTADITVERLEPDWRTKLLAVITNPNVAYILMLVGIYGILFEFYSPGLFGPGIIGAICLLLALYALHVLPVNYTGLALLILGVVLMIAETVSPAFGILGIGGIAAFVIGSILLMDTDVPGFNVAWELIAGIAFTAAALLLATMMMLMQARRRAIVSGAEEMIGLVGRVMDWNDGRGHVFVHGEAWNARADVPLQPEQRARVISLEGLTLTVEPEEPEGRSSAS